MAGERRCRSWRPVAGDDRRFRGAVRLVCVLPAGHHYSGHPHRSVDGWTWHQRTELLVRVWVCRGLLNERTGRRCGRKKTSTENGARVAGWRMWWTDETGEPDVMCAACAGQGSLVLPG